MGDSIGGRGVSSVGFQGAALNFAPPDDEDDEAPARPAKLADPTTAASRKRAGRPRSPLLARLGRCVVVVSVTAAQPLSRVCNPVWCDECDQLRVRGSRPRWGTGGWEVPSVLQWDTSDKTTATRTIWNVCVAQVCRLFRA